MILTSLTLGLRFGLRLGLASPFATQALAGSGQHSGPPSDWSDAYDELELGEADEGSAFAEDERSEGPGASESADPAPGGEGSTRTPKDAPSKTRRGDSGVGGALRLVGAWSHYDDSAQALGLQDDAMLATVGRLLIDHRGDAIKIEFNAFAELGRMPNAGALGGAFGTAGTSLSAYRHEYLTANFWDQGSVTGGVGVDRARVALEDGKWLIEAGRFPISHSVTSFWTPNDFFAPFAANAINKIYKPGVDALRVSVAPTPLSSVDIVATAGWRDGYELAWSHSALILRARTVKWGFDFSALGGKLAQRWVAGGGVQGSFGRVGVRAEGHVGVPDLDGLGPGGDDQGRKVHGRIAGGPNLNFNWRSSTLSAEYAYFSDGAAAPEDYLTRATQRFPDDLPYLGQHYLAASFAGELLPVLSGAALAMVNAQDGSGLAGLTLNYSVADEADLSLGAFLPWGEGLHLSLIHI